MEELIKAFKYIRILDSNSDLKNVVFLGNINEKPAILTLEKTHFSLNNLSENSIPQPITAIESIANNDVYYWGLNLLKEDLENFPSSKINLIYPASETHISKYEKSNFHMIKETPEAYEKVVKPYIEKMKGDRIKWVKNILFEGAESDRVLFKNKDYIILPDMKWDGKSIDSLYVCCIVFDGEISSVRDLNESNIEYLERIQESLLSEITRIYAERGVKRDNLRLYVHYQPSYYHFHIHIVNSNYFGMINSMLTGKAILLGEVIDNLKFLGKEGYAKKTLTYQLSDSHKLWSLGLKNYSQ